MKLRVSDAEKERAWENMKLREYLEELDEETEPQECPRLDDCYEAGKRSCGGCRFNR